MIHLIWGFVQDDLALAIVEGDLPTIEDIFGAYTVLYGDGDLSVGVLHGYARGGGFYSKMLDFRYDIDQRTLAIAINSDYSINCYNKNEAPKQVIHLFQSEAIIMLSIRMKLLFEIFCQFTANPANGSEIIW